MRVETTLGPKILPRATQVCAKSADEVLAFTYSIALSSPPCFLQATSAMKSVASAVILLVA
jgi:hypothetical protein